jgi:HAD superfamily hydrolase (TIGR01490 family)
MGSCIDARGKGDGPRRGSAPRLALFDMDRTLVRVETASLYVRYQREIGEATVRDSARVAWWVALYTFNLIDAPRVAERALAGLRGTPETVLSSRCDDWFRRYVEPHVCDAARLAVAKHLCDGDQVAIVTGASSYAARPLARALRIPHVCATELEVRDGVFTGRPVHPLCYGVGKVARARALAARLGLELRDAVFYSDSVTDLPLLELVRSPVVVNPDPRLAREARRRGWRVERW